jgi:hypothetical protein
MEKYDRIEIQYEGRRRGKGERQVRYCRMR